MNHMSDRRPLHITVCPYSKIITLLLWTNSWLIDTYHKTFSILFKFRDSKLDKKDHLCFESAVVDVGTPTLLCRCFLATWFASIIGSRFLCSDSQGSSFIMSTSAFHVSGASWGWLSSSSNFSTWWSIWRTNSRLQLDNRWVELYKLGQHYVGPRTEQDNKNMMETLIKRIELRNDTGFRDWRCELEMTMKTVQTGAFDILWTRNPQRRRRRCRDGTSACFTDRIHVISKPCGWDVRHDEKCDWAKSLESLVRRTCCPHHRKEDSFVSRLLGMLPVYELFNDVLQHDNGGHGLHPSRRFFPHSLEPLLLRILVFALCEVLPSLLDPASTAEVPASWTDVPEWNTEVSTPRYRLALSSVATPTLP